MLLLLLSLVRALRRHYSTAASCTWNFCSGTFLTYTQYRTRGLLAYRFGYRDCVSGGARATMKRRMSKILNAIRHHTRRHRIANWEPRGSIGGEGIGSWNIDTVCDVVAAAAEESGWYNIILIQFAM